MKASLIGTSEYHLELNTFPAFFKSTDYGYFVRICKVCITASFRLFQELYCDCCLCFFVIVLLYLFLLSKGEAYFQSFEILSAFLFHNI